MAPEDAEREETVRRHIVGRLAWRWFVPVRGMLFIVATALAIAVIAGGLSAMLAFGIFLFSAAATTLLPRRDLRPRLDARRAYRRQASPEPAMRRVVEAMPEPAFLVDRRKVIRVANVSARESFPALGDGDSFALKMREPTLVSALERVIVSGAPERCTITDRVPAERWFSVHIAPIEPGPDGGGPDMFLLLFHDLSEQRRSERMRVDFIANASHELRTPLASLSGFIETLLGPARSDPAAQERFLGVMKVQAERMARLIDDLLSLSRIEMRLHQRPTATVDLAGVISHVADAISPLAGDLGVAVEVSGISGPMPVRGDRDELVQVFENLAENALKYGVAGKRIELSVTPVSEPLAGFRVTVRDFGPGIAPEHLPRLTERFYRVDAASSREKKGTGLGLAIVKHIVNRHRGRLTIDSEPGKGAAFHVTLFAELPANGDSLR
ncbi:MAG: ATP-binding protein [Hyphomicrobiales bacterium]